MKGLYCAFQSAALVGALSLVMAAGVAQAQEPQVDAELVDQLAAPAPTGLQAEQPASQGGAATMAPRPTSKPARDLDAALQQIDQKAAERDLLAIELEVGELRKQVGGTQAGTSELPQLVGLSVAGNNRWAEFMVGNALFQAGAGDWVTAEWQVRDVSASSVVLRSQDGRKTYTMVLGGGQSVPAARK